MHLVFNVVVRVRVEKDYLDSNWVTEKCTTLVKKLNKLNKILKWWDIFKRIAKSI